MDDIDLGAALKPKTKKTPPREPEILEPEIVEGPLPPVPTFDTQPALVKLLEFEKEVKALIAEGKKIGVIKDPETNERAIALASRMKRISNRLEQIRHHFVDPHFKFKKMVDNFFKKQTDPLISGEKELGRKSGSFRLLQEQERRRKQAEQEAETRRLQEELKAQAKKSEEEGKPFQPVTVAQPVVPEPQKVTRTAEGSASAIYNWDFEVTEPEKVPREFLTIDEKAIRKAVKDGRREIPGVRIFEKMDTRIRV